MANFTIVFKPEKCPTTRITQSMVDNLQSLIAEWLDCKQKQLDNLSGKDYPNEDRIEIIDSQIAILENIADELSNWEN